MTYRHLEALSRMDGVKLMEKLSDDSNLAMMSKLTCDLQLRGGWMPLVVKVLAKLCRVEYEPIVVRLFQKLCKKQFLDQLLLHIVQLSSDSSQTNLESVADFLRHFCELSVGVLKLSPVLACEKLENLVKKAAYELSELSPFEGSDSIQKELDQIKAKVRVEKERVGNIRASVQRERTRVQPVSEFAPPENFRELSVFPTVDDIMVIFNPYLRKNLKEGPYSSVEHYLDIQFRLLREDFFRTVRDGVKEYLQKLRETPTVKRKRNIKVSTVRIYEKVQFLKVKTVEENIGLELCFDPEKEFASTMNFDYPKRFIMGSLLMLTRDAAFSSVVLVTVLKREPKELEAGRVLVELCEGAVSKDLFTGHFLLVEAKQFFGVYCSVLRALKDFNEDNFPMTDYLVRACSERRLPDYQLRALQAARLAGAYPADGPPPALFFLPVKSEAGVGRIPVAVDNLQSWPSAQALGLDDSQYRALCGAITNKVATHPRPSDSIACLFTATCAATDL
jgi:hypothetical protein